MNLCFTQTLTEQKSNFTSIVLAKYLDDYENLLSLLEGVHELNPLCNTS